MFFYVGFICEFDMQYYPFDNQVCMIKLSPKIGEERLIRLVMTKLTFIGHEDIKQYLLKNISHYEEVSAQPKVDIFLKTIQLSHKLLQSFKAAFKSFFI